MFSQSLKGSIVAMTIAVVSQQLHAQVTVFDLGALGTSIPSNGVYSINNSGQIVGQANLTSVGNAFRTNASTPISNSSEIGSMGAATGSLLSIVRQINNNGVMVGSALTSPNSMSHAFRSAPNANITVSNDMGTLDGGALDSSVGNSVNSSGQVTGDSHSNTTGNTRAFRAANSPIGAEALEALGTLGGTNSFGLDINTSGQVVGWSSKTNDASIHAYRTVANGSINAASDLGTLYGGTNSFAYAINDSGQVVGSSNYFGTTSTHAFRTTAGGSITLASDLGILAGNFSKAWDINASGQVVGESTFAIGQTPVHAFFVDVTGGMIDLNSFLPVGSPWVLQQATSINDSGVIVGNGLFNGVYHGFVLTVPEPASLGIIGVSSLLLLGRGRQRRSIEA